MPLAAPHAADMPRSGIRRIMDLVWTMPDPVIGLHVGEPSSTPPTHVIEGAAEALARGDTRYVPNPGIPALRTAISEKVASRNGLTADPEQVVVSAGGTNVLSVLLAMAHWPLKEGDQDAVLAREAVIDHVLEFTTMGDDPGGRSKVDAAVALLTSTSAELTAEGWKPRHARSRKRRNGGHRRRLLEKPTEPSWPSQRLPSRP